MSKELILYYRYADDPQGEQKLSRHRTFEDLIETLDKYFLFWIGDRLQVASSTKLICEYWMEDE